MTLYINAGSLCFEGCLQSLATCLLLTAISKNPWRSKSTGLPEAVLISRVIFQVKDNCFNMPGSEKSERARAFNRHL